MARLTACSRAEQPAELSLVLTDDIGISRINREYLNRTGPTDVICFKYDPLPGEDNSVGGEIIVNVERALVEGRARGSVARELALYLAHGCDHLAGESDVTKAGYMRMRRRESRWLRDADRLGMIVGLLRPVQRRKGQRQCSRR
jgi:rRNA maturation RNase YbeY